MICNFTHLDVPLGVYMSTLASSSPNTGKSVGSIEKFIFHVQIAICFHHFPGLLTHNSSTMKINLKKYCFQKYLKQNLKSQSQLHKFPSPSAMIDRKRLICDTGEQVRTTQLVGQLLRGLTVAVPGFRRNGQHPHPQLQD